MKAEEVKTVEDAQLFFEGIYNDVASGLMDKKEFNNVMAEYTLLIYRKTEKKFNKVKK